MVTNSCWTLGDGLKWDARAAAGPSIVTQARSHHTYRCAEEHWVTERDVLVGFRLRIVHASGGLGNVSAGLSGDECRSFDYTTG